MDSHSFSPDERSPVRFVDNAELAYIMLRYRQVHDLWHVMSGHETSVMSGICFDLFMSDL
jgi:ubiquinone biosynthesis protein COQ4